MPRSKRCETVGLEVLEIVKKKKAVELWQASDDLDNAWRLSTSITGSGEGAC